MATAKKKASPKKLTPKKIAPKKIAPKKIADSIALQKAIENVANNLFQYTCWKHDYPNATKAKAFAAKSESALVKLRNLVTNGWTEPAVLALAPEYEKLYLDIQGSASAYKRSIARTQSQARFFEQKRPPETLEEYVRTWGKAKKFPSK